MKWWVIPGAVLAVLAACSGRSRTATVEEIDGVRYVHNHAPVQGDDPGLGLELIKTIGSTETDDDRYILLLPLDAVTGDDGSLFIMDSRRPAIRKYGPDGVFVADFGREGSGPGEFRGSICMDRDQAGNLYFTDMNNTRLGSFSPAGEVRPAVVLKQFFHVFRLLSDGRIVGVDISREEDPPKAARLLDAEGNPQMTFGATYQHEESFMEFMLNMRTIARDEIDGIYLCFDHYNRIDRYSPGGELQMQIDRPLDYPVQHDLVMGMTDVRGEEMAVPEPDLTHVSSGIGVDGSGRIWVLTFVTQPEDDGSASALMENAPERMRFEVYNPDGVLLCYVPVPVDMSRFRVFGDRLLILDAYWNACVYEYRIVDAGN